MNISTLADLTELLAILKTHNVTEFKCGELQLTIVNKDVLPTEKKPRETNFLEPDNLKELYSHLPSFMPLKDEPPQF